MPIDSGLRPFPPHDPAVRKLGVARGGTGATDAATARGNLGAASSGPIGSSGLTMATARLLGRSGSGTGAVEEIAIGAGLDLTSGTLSATGGGGGDYDPDYITELLCPCTVVANSFVNMIARSDSTGTGSTVASANASDLADALWIDGGGGAAQLRRGTTSTGRAHCLFAANPGSTTFRYFRPTSGQPWIFGAAVIASHRPDTTDDFVLRVGFQFVNNSADPNDPMAQFVVDRTLNSGSTWHVQARATTGGSRTTVDTGVGVNRTSDSTPAWNRMRLTWEPGSLKWWIDGESGEITTNVPDTMLGCGVNINGIAGTAQRDLFWGGGRLWRPRTTRRW